MDWTPIVTLVLGGAIGLGSSVIQLTAQRRTEQGRWLRDQRQAAYSSFLESFDRCLTTLHFKLDDLDNDEHPPADLLSVGSARQLVDQSLLTLELLGPANVVDIARQLRFVTVHFVNTVGYSTNMYSYYNKVPLLQRQFVEECQGVLGVSTSTASDLTYQQWRQAWVGED